MVLTMVVLGGTGSITGSALAAIALTALPEWLRNLKAADGSPLTASLASVLGTALAVVLFTSAVRWVQRQGHAFRLPNSVAYGLISVGAVVVALVAGSLLNLVPFLASQAYDFSVLRLVIFAGILVIVMLIRPEGVLGHHEFGWHLFRRPKEAGA